VRTLLLDGRSALLVRPRRARALLVLAHGAGAGMRHAFLAGLADALAAHAIATLRWELPYMAAGKQRVDPPAVAEAAVQATWRDAARRFERLPMFAGGKSFGGRMTSGAHATAALPGARGVILVGFPLFDKPQRAEHLARATGPVLVVQGTRDTIAEMRAVVAALGPRATLYEVAGADHGFAAVGRKPAEILAELAGAIAAWMEALLSRHGAQAGGRGDAGELPPRHRDVVAAAGRAPPRRRPARRDRAAADPHRR
jgi:predicted alpha/beta-hydrolase family hydrolase